jgi:hypothetical protein
MNSLLYILIFASLCGLVEAAIFSQVTWNLKQKLKKPYDTHFYLNLLRIFTGFLIFDNSVNIVIYSLCFMGMFPLLHDGVYYTAYNKFNSKVYTKRFMDQSITTDAEFSFVFTHRVILFTVSFTTYLLYYFI